MCGSRNSAGITFSRQERRSQLFFLRLLCLLAAVLGGCAKREPGFDGKPTTAPQILRLSQRNEPGDLDSATATLPDEFAVLRAFSEGLLIPGANGHPQPGAASRYDVSPDGLTYTFHLRANGRWSDGQPVTADEFVASWRRVLTPSTAAPKANVFYPVKNARAFVSGEITDFNAVGIRATGAHTITITLDRPNPRFPYYVASGPWLPAPVRVIEKQGRLWTRPGNFVGNGPFALVEWRPDQRIVAKRNPHWHGAASVQLAEIHFMRFDSGDSEERAFRTGQIDATMSVPSSKIETYTHERAGELHRAPMIETRYFSFNTQRHPLNDVRVRRALSLALDRQAIVDNVLKGGQAPASRLIPPGLRDPAAATASLELGSSEYRHDPTAARQLLAAAGINGKDFPRLEVTAWSPSQTPVLEAAQQMWRQALGIETSLAIREARVHLSALAAGDYDIAFVTAIPDVADATELMGDFVSKAPENYPRWSDARFDAAFVQAASEASAQPQAVAVLAAERLLLEAAPIAPVYFNTKIWLMSPRVKGWQEDGLWTRCYQQIYLEDR